MGKKLKNSNLKGIFPVFIGMYGLTVYLIMGNEGRAVSSIGVVSRTSLRHFEFFAKIANPCEITPGPGGATVVSPSTSTTLAPTRDELRLDFYQSLATQVQITQNKLGILESNVTAECNGLSLNSLPITPTMEHFTEVATITQTYQTAIFLATHFHLMLLDRETNIQGDSNIPDDQLEEENVPAWRFMRCGNESQSFPVGLLEVTESMENVLCTILSSTSDEQRSSFRHPFNKLRATVLYRYHNSCSALLTRDCLVLREAKQALGLILIKFAKLIRTGFPRSNGTNENEMMENSL